MRLEDHPTAAGAIDIDAAREAVWDLVADPARMGEFSPENEGGSWDPPATGPAVGATFTSGNSRGDLRWVRTSTVTDCARPRVFGFVVGDPADPNATWRFELHPTRSGGTRLVEHMTFGTAPSPLTAAIAASPDRHEAIVANRAAEHTRNIAATLDAVKAAAEAASNQGR